MTNEVVMNFSSNDAPFGGVGDSGYGVVKGKPGYEAMSNNRSYFKMPNSSMMDAPIRYAGYDGDRMAFFKKVAFLGNVYPDAIITWSTRLFVLMVVFVLMYY